MDALNRLKKARNVDELASQFEPLAVAMTTLTDETHKALVQMQEMAHKSTTEWERAQRSVSAEWRTAAQEMQAAARAMRETSAQIPDPKGDLLNMMLVSMSSVAVTAALCIVFFLYLAPEPKVSLNPAAVAKAIAQEMKPNRNKK